jgi:hypothetical protein
VRGRRVMPDPVTCTHDAWAQYLASVDHRSMTGEEARTHRAGSDAYGARLQREQAAAHDRNTRLFDERDRTAIDAEALSGRCQRLQAEVLELGAEAQRRHRELGWSHPATVEARQRQNTAAEALTSVRQALAAANAAAVQAYRDAR